MNNDVYMRLVGLDVEEEEVHELMCEPPVYEYLADGIEPPPSVSEDWLRTSFGDFERFGGGLWALESPRGRKMLGLVRVSDFENGGAQLTYLLHPSIWGQGYATRMAHTAMTLAFEARIATSIWAGADVANGASVAVMKRLGMNFRRNVDYPAGPGIEYVMTAAAFDIRRVEPVRVRRQYHRDTANPRGAADGPKTQRS